MTPLTANACRVEANEEREGDSAAKSQVCQGFWAEVAGKGEESGPARQGKGHGGKGCSHELRPLSEVASKEGVGHSKAQEGDKTDD